METDAADWILHAVAVLGGGVVGVLVDKIVGDAFLAGGIPNPEFMYFQTHDVILIATELVGAYVAAEAEVPLASSFLVGMAGAVIVTDVYHNVAAMGPWLRPVVATIR